MESRLLDRKSGFTHELANLFFVAELLGDRLDGLHGVRFYFRDF